MFRREWIVLAAVMILPGVCQASSIAYSRVKAGKSVAHVVTADLNNPQVKVTVALAKGGTGSQEQFKSMVSRTRPVAAITGTFFDTKTLMPTGDIAVFGTLLHSGCIGSALCIDSGNKARIISLKEGRKNGWLDYETVMCAGPTLVRQGKVSISLKAEGFRNSLTAPARRTAVGISKAGKLLLVTINRDTSLHDIARVLVGLGAVDALCLDGGSSTALYCSGNYIAVPGRQLTNCLVVYSGEDAYYAAKPALAPASCFASAPLRQTVSVSPRDALHSVTGKVISAVVRNQAAISAVRDR